MKTIQALPAGLLLAGFCWLQPALAQGVPPGSYLRSCGEVYLQGDTLVATCRRADGGPRSTSLPGVRGCVGDIGNRNGRLTCNYADAPAPSQPYGGAPGYGGPGYGAPGYGGPGYGGPGYGNPGYAPPYGR
jgi:hypothetical protein